VRYSELATFSLVPHIFFSYSDLVIFRFHELFLDFVNHFLDFGHAL
jgi:hypothetical protein